MLPGEQAETLSQRIAQQQVARDVKIEQKLTQRPIGTEYADFGYLFVTAMCSDGHSELVPGALTTVSVTSPNVILTAPNGTDASRESLPITNEAIDNWMVAVAPNANKVREYW